MLVFVLNLMKLLNSRAEKNALKLRYEGFLMGLYDLSNNFKTILVNIGAVYELLSARLSSSIWVT